MAEDCREGQVATGSYRWLEVLPDEPIHNDIVEVITTCRNQLLNQINTIIDLTMCALGVEAGVCTRIDHSVT